MHALIHAHIDVPAAELSMPYALRFPRFICLIFTYLFILPAPSLYFTSFSTFLLVRSQTHFGSGPTSARKQHHTALAGVFQVFRGWSCAVQHGGAVPAGEGCSRSRAVRQFTYLDCNPKVLSHRDVWRRTLSHSNAGEVFIRLLCLNWRRAESSLCVILLAGRHTSRCHA